METPKSTSTFSKRFIIAALSLAVMVALGAAAIITDNAGASESTLLDNGQHLLSDVNLSPEEAVTLAQSEHSGEVEDVDLEQKGDEIIYEIVIGDEEVFVDALTGDILYLEHDNDDGFTSRQKIDRDDAVAGNS